MKKLEVRRRGAWARAFPLLIGLSLAAAGCRQWNREPERLPPAHLSSVPLSYAGVVEHVSPAVVTVRSSKRIVTTTQYPFSGGGLFQQLFGGGYAAPPPQVEIESALGSGVIVKADGYILTNNHVIAGAQEIRVDLNNRRTYAARLVGADAPSDLAVLKIDDGSLPVLTLGDSDRVRVGDICLAIGNPLGVGETVTSGIISAKGRRTGLSNGAFEDFLQTDAPINQGNSGGALVNTTGELIGINSQIISTTGGNIGLGFAIPSNMARTVMDQLIGKGKVVRGHLGVTVQPMTSNLAESFGLKNVGGVLVNSVEVGGPADHAGLKTGDVITALNGKKVDDPNSFRNDLAATSPGTAVTLSIVRDGNPMEVRPTLTETPASQRIAGSSGAGSGTPSRKLGVTIAPLTPDIASQLGVSPGTAGMVITALNPLGAAADAGLQAGDIIVSINHIPVHSEADVNAALAKSAKPGALFLIDRGGQNLFVMVNLG